MILVSNPDLNAIDKDDKENIKTKTFTIDQASDKIDLNSVSS